MDGIGFIATLHATTLDDQGQRPILLKPTKTRNRRVSSNSIPERARSLVGKGKNILSFNLPSPEASSRSRRSGASSTASRSDQGDEARPSTTESNGASFFSARTSCAQREEQAKQEALDSDSSDSHGSFRTPPPMSRPSAHLVTQVWSHPHFDPNWISTFIDNSYLFPIDSPSKAQSNDEKSSGDRETRPSSPSIVAPTLVFSSEIHRAIPLTDSRSSCPPHETRLPQLRQGQALEAQPTPATT